MIESAAVEAVRAAAVFGLWFAAGYWRARRQARADDRSSPRRPKGLRRP